MPSTREADPDERSVQFTDGHDEVSAASVLPPDGGRGARGRIPTGYVSGDAGAQLADGHSVGTSASSGGGRSIRDRKPTAFVPGTRDTDPDERSAQFTDGHGEVSAASVLPLDGGRAVRGRIPTGYVSGDTGVQFADGHSVGTSASSGGDRSIRDRTPTAFVPGTREADPDERSAQFTNATNIAGNSGAVATNGTRSSSSEARSKRASLEELQEELRRSKGYRRTMHVDLLEAAIEDLMSERVIFRKACIEGHVKPFKPFRVGSH